MLYKLNKESNRSNYSKVKRTTLKDIGWKEEDLQSLISNNIQDFIFSNELMTIFTERKRQEEPDILALDSNGDLYIFELKRWGAKQENLLQVLRYGQLFGKSNYDELNELYKKYQTNKQANLSNDHTIYFEISESQKLSEDKYNQKQKFLVVTNGLDQETVDAIIYWKSNGLNVDAIVYWVFEIENEHYIEFNTYSKTKEFLEYENNCYVLNTNMTSNSKYTEEMLNKKKAAAYYPGWREKIQKFQKGDRIFLYKSGTGIIAYGYADGKLNKAVCDGHIDYEYNMKLDSFVKLKFPISPSELKKITQRGFNFRQTLFSITEDVADKILVKAKSEIDEK
ncbi:MAG: hypothetical protein RR623_09780 [Bacilli bacterium]